MRHGTVSDRGTDTGVMNDRLVALALIRATLKGDHDSLHVILTGHPPTPELLASLVTLAASILEHGLGEDRALAAVEDWMRKVLEG